MNRAVTRAGAAFSLTENENPRKRRRRPLKFVEGAASGIFFVLGMTAIVCVLLITVYLVISGLPAIIKIGPTQFLFGRVWKSTASEPQFGILPFILTSIYGTLGAAVIGIPIGLFTSIYLAKLAHRRSTAIIGSTVDLLAGIPSVVYGLLGLMILVPFLRTLLHVASGTSLLAAMIILGVMILPNIISVSTNAIRSVPQEYEEASIALGATQMETVMKVSVPAAKSGIAAGIVLGIGRAVGEAMAVMMVAGNVANMPSLLKSVTFLTTAISKEMSYATGLQREALFSIALVLFVFIMILNIILNVILKRGEKA